MHHFFSSDAHNINITDYKLFIGQVNSTVDHIGFQYNQQSKTGWGQHVILLHSDGSKTLYAHLLENSTTVLKVGNKISKGEVIGKTDTTGGATLPHLHFQYAPNGKIYDNDSLIDPYPCINSNLTGQITLSDNGPLADDAFSLTLDGLLIGQTNIGASNTFAVNNLRQGEHTIKIDVVIAPDDAVTVLVDLGYGVTFADGTKSKSEELASGGSVTYTIIVGSSP